MAPTSRIHHVDPVQHHRKKSSHADKNSKPMLFEGWLSKRVGPEVFSRRYLKLTASGLFEWSKTQSHTSKRSTLALGLVVSSVSKKLESLRGMHCFVLSVTRNEEYIDEDIESEDQFESLVFGSADKHEVSKWLALIQEEIHHQHSNLWSKSLSSSFATHKRSTNRKSNQHIEITSLSWLSDIETRHWDDEWQSCLSILNGLNQLMASNVTNNEENPEASESEAVENDADHWGTLEDDDEVSIKGERLDRPLIKESIALRQKLSLYTQFEQFLMKVLHEIATAISQITVQEQELQDEKANITDIASSVLLKLRGVHELGLPDWLEGHSSVMAGESDPPNEDSVRFSFAGCCFEIVSFSVAPNTSLGVAHGIDALQQLQRHAGASGHFITPLCCYVDYGGYRLAARAMPSEFGQLEWCTGASSVSGGDVLAKAHFAVKRAFHLECCPSMWVMHDTFTRPSVKPNRVAPSPLMVFTCALLLPPNIDSTSHPLSHQSSSPESSPYALKCEGLYLALTLSSDSNVLPSLVGLPLKLNPQSSPPPLAKTSSFKELKKRGSRRLSEGEEDLTNRTSAKRKEQTQQRMVEMLMGVGAVLRVPPEEVRCHQSTQSGFTLWYASGGSFNREGEAANLAWAEAAKNQHVPLVAVGLAKRLNNASKKCSVNDRASEIAKKTIRGPALLTARMDVEMVGENLTRAPVRFRREFLNSCAEPFVPFEPSQVKTNPLPPKFGRPKLDRKDSRKPPRRRRSAEEPSETLAEVALQAAAVQLRAAARELGSRLRCCGDAQGRTAYDEEEDETMIVDDEGEEEMLDPKGLTNEIAVFHGAHVMSLAHKTGVNSALLPEIKAALPTHEISVHQIIVAEMLASSAKQALRCRLLCARAWPFDGGPCDTDDEDTGDVGGSHIEGISVDLSVEAALLNEILFDPSCPLEVLERDITKLSELCDSSSGEHRGGFTSAVEDAQRLIDNVKSRGRLVIGGVTEGGESGDWDPVLKAPIDSELWLRRREAQVIARRLTRKHNFWWKVESRAYLQLGFFGSVGSLNIEEHASKLRHICEGLSPLQLLAPLLRHLEVTLTIPVLRHFQHTGRVPPLHAKHLTRVKESKFKVAHKLGLSEQLKCLAKARHHTPTSLEELASGDPKPFWTTSYANLAIDVFGPRLSASSSNSSEEENTLFEDVSALFVVEGFLKSALHVLMQEDPTEEDGQGGMETSTILRNVEGAMRKAEVLPVEVLVAYGVVEATQHLSSGDLDEAALRRAWRVLMLICPAVSDTHSLDLFSTHPLCVAIAQLLRAHLFHKDQVAKSAQSGFEVFDLVEVRDGEEEWERGCVESLDADSGRPRVVKEGYETAYLWDEVRRIKEEEDSDLMEDSLVESEDTLPWLEALLNTTSVPMHWNIVNKNDTVQKLRDAAGDDGDEVSKEVVLEKGQKLWHLTKQLCLSEFSTQSSALACSPLWVLEDRVGTEMGCEKDAAKVAGRLYVGGNLFGFSADDKGKLSKKSQQNSDEGSDKEENAGEDNEEKDDNEEITEAPLFKGLLASGNWVIRQLSCGYRHTALVTTTGLLLTCGHGETGRLGHGDEMGRTLPTLVSAFLQGINQSGNKEGTLKGGKESIISVACGREHTVAIGVSGTAYSWGWGEAGRLGIGEVGATLLPTAISEFKHGDKSKKVNPPVCSGVACGREHTLLLTTSGLVFASGPGYGGRLGLGNSNKDVLYPTMVNYGNDLEHELVVCAAAGDMHSAITTQSGCVYTWGFGATGALGHGDKEGGGLSNQFIPKRVDAFLTNFADFIEIDSVSCGAYHTLALSRKGEVFSFGDGESGALGLADRGDASTHRAATPMLVHTLHELQLETSSNQLNDSAVAYGELLKREQCDDSLVRNEDGSGRGAICSISAGHLTSSCVDRSGKVYIWGCAFAEDGVQPQEVELTPRKIEPQEGYSVVKFRAVGMGGYHTVALTEVYDRWGRGFDSSFNGLEGLQLKPAEHQKVSLIETKASIREEDEEEEDDGGKRRKPRGAGDEDSMIGRLRIAAPSLRDRHADNEAPQRHRSLFIASPILNTKRR